VLPTWTIWLWGRKPRVTLLRALVLGVLLYLVGRFAFPPVHVAGQSMEPTIHDGTWRLGNKLKFLQREPQRGELVMVRMAGWRAFYLKRVLALPGETIAFSKGVLQINGRAQPEPYLHGESNWSLPATRVPEDEYFVAGDNRAVPLAAHKAGLTRRSDIVGGLLW
jgi:signal peptidase I